MFSVLHHKSRRIGCGLIGQKRAKSLGRARLVACSDLAPQKAEAMARSVTGCVAATILFLPFWLVFVPLLGYVARPLCYWLDRLDLSKTFTIGYTAVFRKGT